MLAATASLAGVRFHGHSAEWDSHDIHEGFGYRYQSEEFTRWAPKIRGLPSQADTTHVVFNNCCRDYAQTSAQQLAHLLSRA